MRRGDGGLHMTRQGVWAQNSLAASELAGEVGFGSGRRDWMDVRMAATSISCDLEEGAVAQRDIGPWLCPERSSGFSDRLNFCPPVPRNGERY